MPGLQFELAFRHPEEEAVVDRLDHIFGIQLLTDQVVQTGAGETNQSVGKAMEDLGGSIPVPGLQPGNQLSK